MTADLTAESLGFASRMTDLLGRTVGGGVQFDVVEVDLNRSKVGPAPFSADESGFALVPLRRSCDPQDQPERLSLKVEFDLNLDDEKEHLTVLRSTFGLWVRPHPKRSPRPVVRIEYDRDATGKPAAHVHLHAESVELGWIYGTAGERLTRMQEIHFPVGGRRFRPTVEDFLQFLHRERLFRDWELGWQTVVQGSLDEFVERQARATVRRHEHSAADQLRAMGYTVVPPSD